MMQFRGGVPVFDAISYGTSILWILAISLYYNRIRDVYVPNYLAALDVTVE